MALIKLGVAVAQVRGSIEGVTFSQNKGGAYIRNRSLPTNPNTPAQQSARNIISQLAYYWRNTLTSAQRAAWSARAASTVLVNKLGDNYNPTGMQLFVRNNAAQQGLVWDAPSVETTPPATAIAPLPVVTLTLNHTTGLSITNVEPGGSTWILWIYASPVLSASINFFKGPFRKLKSIDDGETLPYVDADLAGGAAGQVRFLAFRSAVEETETTSHAVSNLTIVRAVIA